MTIEGHWLGMKLFGVEPGSVAHAVGLRSGDVVEEINGVAMRSVEATQLLEQQLFADQVDSLRISFARVGEVETIAVNIED